MGGSEEQRNATQSLEVDLLSQAAVRWGIWPLRVLQLLLLQKAGTQMGIQLRMAG